jgi:hypothetical protein
MNKTQKTSEDAEDAAEVVAKEAVAEVTEVAEATEAAEAVTENRNIIILVSSILMVKNQCLISCILKKNFLLFWDICLISLK